MQPCRLCDCAGFDFHVGPATASLVNKGQPFSTTAYPLPEIWVRLSVPPSSSCCMRHAFPAHSLKVALALLLPDGAWPPRHWHHLLTLTKVLMSHDPNASHAAQQGKTFPGRLAITPDLRMLQGPWGGPVTIATINPGYENDTDVVPYPYVRLDTNISQAEALQEAVLQAERAGGGSSSNRTLLLAVLLPVLLGGGALLAGAGFLLWRRRRARAQAQAQSQLLDPASKSGDAASGSVALVMGGPPSAHSPHSHAPYGQQQLGAMYTPGSHGRGGSGLHSTGSQESYLLGSRVASVSHRFSTCVSCIGLNLHLSTAHLMMIVLHRPKDRYRPLPACILGSLLCLLLACLPG